MPVFKGTVMCPYKARPYSIALVAIKLLMPKTDITLTHQLAKLYTRARIKTQVC